MAFVRRVVSRRVDCGTASVANHVLFVYMYHVLVRLTELFLRPLISIQQQCGASSSRAAAKSTQTTTQYSM